MTVFGLPPFLPFSRAAVALAALATFPPLRPRATACGFLDMRGLRFQARNQRHEVRVLGHGEAVVETVRPLRRDDDGAGFFREADTGRAEGVGSGEGSNSVDHVERINPSGLVVNNKVRAA